MPDLGPVLIDIDNVSAALAAGEAPMPDRFPTAYPPEHGTRYLLPCAVLGLGGLYEYVLIDTTQASQWLAAAPYVSYLTHPLLKLALERLTGTETPLGRRPPWPLFGYHDEGLIFQVDGYETLPQQLFGCSLRLRALLDEERYTLGLLRRLS